MAMIDQREKIVQIVRTRGPLLPSQINKELNTNILFASAMLSELVDAKRIRLSRLKIGGSPLYYMEGQEHKLQEYSNRLHEKEQKAFERLRMQKILKESEQEPVIRAALREIKDFAKPLEVTSDGTTDIFWKWYLLPQEEAERIIKEKIESAEQNAKQKFTEQKREQQPFVPQEPVLMPQQQQQVQQPIQQVQQQPVQQPIMQPKQETAEKQEAKEEIYPAHPENYFSTVRANLLQEKEQKQEKEKNEIIKNELVKKEAVNNEAVKKQKETQKTIPQKSVQQQLKKDKTEETPKEQEPQKITEIDDDFLKMVLQYFNKNEIKLTSHNIIRKNSEIDFRIIIPSNIGSLSFFCKARKKSKCNEGDLSKLFLDGQKMKMPVLFLTTGDLTKKAAAMLSDEFKNITVKKL